MTVNGQDVMVALGFATLIVTLVTVAVRIERRLGKAMTWEDHKKVCDEKRNETVAAIALLRDDIARQGSKLESFTEASNRRGEENSRLLAEQAGKVAVIEERLGNLVRETDRHSHKRRDDA